MGLDWCVKSRTNANGLEISPAATAGALALSRDNPTSIDAFREVWDSHCKNALSQTGKDNDEAEDIVRKLGETPGFRVEPIDGGDEYCRRWLRPFETVLDERLAEIKASGRPQYMVDTIPADSPARALVSGFAVSLLDFRGKIIGYMHGLPTDVQDRAYNDMEPETARAYADELAEYRDAVSEDDRRYLDAAVAWLRFWAERGHGIFAWY